MKLKKGEIIKDIEREKEVGDYIAAGWEKIEDKKITFPKNSDNK